MAKCRMGDGVVEFDLDKAVRCCMWDECDECPLNKYHDKETDECSGIDAIIYCQDREIISLKDNIEAMKHNHDISIANTKARFMDVAVHNLVALGFDEKTVRSAFDFSVL